MAKATDLSRYEAKRDFQKTAEPRGADGVKASDQLRFVVQKHDATRLHFDLRLELDGVFKSWAVTKGPSLNPSDKRLAVEVEDHPLGYGDFEGTIPNGQYGGGTVQLFDRGVWAPELDKPPEQSLEDGELKFVLAGERLKGSFVLVRIKNDKFGGKRTNWLLIKHRDADANDGDDGGGVLAIEESVASGRTLATIAAGEGRAPKPFMLGDGKAPAPDAIWDSNKGLAKEERRASGRDKPEPKTAGASPKAKLAAGTKKATAKRAAAAETAAPEPIPDFVAPQLCATVDKPPAGAKWIHEIKFDGYRVQVRVERKHAILRTRSGLDWTAKFAAIIKAAAALPEGLYDGEIVALDGDGKPDFSALQAAISAGKTDALVCFVFDLLHADGADLRKVPLGERKARLAAILDKRRAGKAILRFVDHFEADGASLFASASELGLEGIVSKRLDAAYRSGRSDSWTKAKCRPSHEVVVGGWTDTGGKFRSLLGGVFRDGKLVFVGRIGTGFPASTIEQIMPRLKAAARDKTPFDRKALPPDTRKAHWLEPTLVAEVEFAGWTGDGSMRQAAFKGLRDDKLATDVEAIVPPTPKQAVVEQEPATAAPAHTGRAKTAATTVSAGTKRSDGKGKAEIMGVAISHPEKALWPDAADDGMPVTKRDLALYFEAVGAWMLPHIADRPCSIIRAPDGIEGQTFFQRHAMAGSSKLLHTMEIAGDRAPYVSIGSVEALAAVAQSGGLELHPSNCAPGAPDVPGRLVFDLDPAPDVAFAEVVAAAKTVKEVLELLGLVTFAKTTGGKGLHVVVPLVPDDAVSWEQAKGFAHDVCRAIERDAPTKYLTKQSKAARKGRIYLDYLRNDRLSTAVAPLSPRGRPHAPVSMPLTWAQVKADLDPARYTIRSVPRLLARSKAWDEYVVGAQPIAEAMKRLGKL